MAKTKKRVKVAAGAPIETAAAEPSAAEIASVQNLQQVQMPEWYASGVQLVITSNDVGMIFTKPIMLGAAAHGGSALAAGVALIAPVGMVRMSAETLKDIAVLLKDQVEKIEAERGVIETAFTRKRAADKEASKKKH